MANWSGYLKFEFCHGGEIVMFISSSSADLHEGQSCHLNQFLFFGINHLEMEYSI